MQSQLQNFHRHKDVHAVIQMRRRCSRLTRRQRATKSLLLLLCGAQCHAEQRFLLLTDTRAPEEGFPELQNSKELTEEGTVNDAQGMWTIYCQLRARTSDTQTENSSLRKRTQESSIYYSHLCSSLKNKPTNHFLLGTQHSTPNGD